MIDARGYTCPMPVLMVQKELKKNAPAALAVTTSSSRMLTTAVTFCQCRRFLSSSSIGCPPFSFRRRDKDTAA